ncbi:peptidoglycan/LPS O-acetylase OafA/YrhL [Actinoplanes octamycinicus]|uniref:Peptidoglycan/LPS O-acetylase OafA/YrhL n=1 Tax=Actinoplanes octamycinicus TaxID=135948 RepID=A0A7W7H048_9ACTN|nr:acyltransferase family protein [Actinoplanes octamycinicus]MBB4741531.1 peptidoglycan/LPS O-acetylase OafA/YrhL [Actinoplanes octamycinicus]GIE57081.1 membrane protein [Actinoplanes octamycinicus]
MWEYRPALDGVRALAVTAVLLFHAGVPGTDGGFLGVDAFFVLSGFLITSLLLAEHQRSGRIDLGRFWLHRARRLLPALLAMLVATVVTARFLLDSDALGLLRADAWAALGYAANWRMIFRGTGYLAATAAPSPLQHTWSLAIEEQFYLVWPLLVAGVLIWLVHRRARAVLVALCVTGAVTSQVLCALLYQPSGIGRAYFGTDTRAQALLIGAVAALLTAPAATASTPPRYVGAPTARSTLSRYASALTARSTRPRHASALTARPTRSRYTSALTARSTRPRYTSAPAARSTRFRYAGALAWAGVGGTVVLWHTASEHSAWLYRGGLTLAALAAAAVIVDVVRHPRGLLARLLSVPPLVRLGRISYGVYLWHWPLFTFVTTDLTGLSRWPLLAVRLAGTLAVAVVSYHLVEQPVRHGALGRLLPRRVPAAATTATVAAVAVAIGWCTVTPAEPATAAAPIVIAPLDAPAQPGLNPGTASHARPNGDIEPAAQGRPSGDPGPASQDRPSGDARPAPQDRPNSDPGPAPQDRPSGDDPGPAPQGRPAPIDRPGRPPGREPRVTFLGDSVSWTIGSYLPEHPGMWTSVRAIQGCGIATLPEILQLGSPHTNYPGCTSWPRRWQRAVDRDNPDVAVVELNRWELMDRRYQGRYQHVGEPAYDDYLIGQLERAVRVAGSRGAAVALLTAAYTRRAERPDGGLYPEDRPERVDAWNRLLHRVADRHPGTVTVLDLNAVTCPDGKFTWHVRDVRMRSDGLHFTPSGVQRVIAPWLLPRLAALAAGR